MHRLRGKRAVAAVGALTVALGLVATAAPPVWAHPGNITEFTVPTATNTALPIIITGPDDALWFTEPPANKIGRVTTDGEFTEFTVPTANSAVGNITTGPDGNLWFTERAANKIGRLTTEGVFTEFATPTAGRPLSITAGPDGNLWFTEFDANKIGRVTTEGVFTEFTVPSPNSMPGGITVGPGPEPAGWEGRRASLGGRHEENHDDSLWFNEFNTNKIGRITTDGVFTEFTIPTANSGPTRVTRGPDGDVWFTENTANKVGRVTAEGVFTEFAVPRANSKPFGITSGPDDNVWFTEQGANRIGRLSLDD